MKRTNLLTLAVLSSVLVLTSCSKDDTAELCAECHIALPDKSETVWEIVDASGKHIVFCGQDLVDAEENSREVADTLYSEAGDTLLPGVYGPGSANSQYEIHCGEEHEDH